MKISIQFISGSGIAGSKHMSTDSFKMILQYCSFEAKSIQTPSSNVHAGVVLVVVVLFPQAFSNIVLSNVFELCCLKKKSDGTSTAALTGLYLLMRTKNIFSMVLAHLYLFLGELSVHIFCSLGWWFYLLICRPLHVISKFKSLLEYWVLLV